LVPKNEECSSGKANPCRSTIITVVVVIIIIINFYPDIIFHGY